MKPPPPAHAPHLVILGKNVLTQPFGAGHVRFGPYQAVARRCRRVDLVFVSEHADGHEEVVGNVHVHAGPPRGGWRGHVAYVRHAWRVLTALERGAPPDIYWVEDPLTAGVLTWWAHLRLGVPWVVAVRADYLHLNKVRWSWLSRALQAGLTRLLTRRATRVRVVARHMRGDLEACGVEAARIVVLPSPTDLSRFEPGRAAAAAADLRASWGWPAEACILVFMGTFTTTKGLDLLLDALARVRVESPLLRLVLVGDGPEREAVEAQVNRLGLGDVVRLTGQVGHDEVPLALAAADGLVLSSRDEGVPRCAVEAAAMARPLVITAVGGCPETVVNEVSGYLVPPTVGGLASGLRRIAALTPPERAELGRRGREHILAGGFEAEANNERAYRDLLLAPWREQPRRR